MKQIVKVLLFLTVLVVVTSLTGCLKGGSRISKTYKLTVTVLADATETPLEGALVKVVGKSLEARATKANGRVSFSGLSGRLEVLVSSLGFTNKAQSVVMDKEQSIIIRLTADAGSVVARDEEDLAKAINDPEVTSIILAQDLVLSTKLLIDRPVNLNLNGKTLTGDVEYDFAEEEFLELAGTGQLSGNLSINAPYASVTNHLHVTGAINILDVASETWNEYGHDNRLMVEGSNIRVNLYYGAQSIEIAEDTWGIRVNIYQGSVADFIANSSVNVTGAGQITRTSVNAEGVVFDYSPGEIGGSEEPEILNPDPDDPHPEKIAGPRFATVSKKDGHYFNFERGKASSEAGEADLKLTWVQTGNEYSMIGFTSCNGVCFSVDRDPIDDDVELVFEHFRAVRATDWESSTPDDVFRLNVFDTLLLKTNTGRLVKLFILEIRGHWQHDDAAAVDFVYLFLDEADLAPPVIEAVTLVTESDQEITKPVHGGVIEFEIKEDPTSIYFTLNEVVYQNRPLARGNSLDASTFTKEWLSARSGYLGSPFSKKYEAGISVYGMSPPWSVIELAAGDEAFYADIDDDQGYFFSDLFGNQLRELPFEKIVIKRAVED